MTALNEMALEIAAIIYMKLGVFPWKQTFPISITMDQVVLLEYIRNTVPLHLNSSILTEYRCLLKYVKAN